MRFLPSLLYGTLAAATPFGLEKRAISQALFDDLTFYFQYASSTFAPLGTCTSPNSNTLIGTFNNITGLPGLVSTLVDTQGFVVRDDTRQEIVVAFRGSTSLADFLIDAVVVPLPFWSPGASAPFGTLVHTGFMLAFNSVVHQILGLVGPQLAQYPNYSLVTSGHSLGGALSSIGAVVLKENYPNRQVRLYNYGAPRVGNSVWASWVNNRIGVSNSFRVVHTTDTVPAIPPRILLYKHHATEYWLNPDPASPANTIQCDSSGEDPNCSASLILPIDLSADQHGLYMGIPAGSRFC